MTAELNDHCCTATTGALLKVEENGRKLIIRNDEGLDCKICRIDGCIVTAGERADFVINYAETHSVIVELKGKDIRKAVSQIDTSFRNSAVKQRLKGLRGAVVVCTNVSIPKAGYFSLKSKQQFARDHKSALRFVCVQGAFYADEVTLKL